MQKAKNNLRSCILAMLSLWATGLAFSQTSWHYVHPQPTADICYDLSFADSLTGFVVAGGSGHVLHTSDGGKSWESQPTGIRTHLLVVSFVDKDHGWACGGDMFGLILRTTNGGKSWTQCTLPNQYGTFRGLQFFDPDTGFAMCERNYLLKTTDGGVSWKPLYAGLGELGPVYFLNPRLGYANLNGIMRTTNGGSTWQRLTPSGSSIGSYDDRMYFTDSLHGFISSGLRTTTDGGVSWQALVPTASLQSLSFPDRAHGWAFGSSGVYATVDSGKTWEKRGTLEGLARGEMVSLVTGYACGGFGNVYRTSDGGLSWESLTHRAADLDLGRVHAFDSLHLWATGDANLHGGLVMRSSDGGGSWAVQYRDSLHRMYGFTVLDAQRAWACGDNGFAIATTNGGAQWMPLPIPVTTPLRSILFRDPLHGWCGADGALLATRDGGQSWQVTPLSQEYDEVRGFYAQDTNRIWAVGGNFNISAGFIMYSTDGGSSWQQRFGGQTNPLRAVTFTDSLTGWAVGDTMLVTTDGGVSWQGRLRPERATVYSLYFENPYQGWMTTFTGTIYRTDNRGAEWVQEETPTSLALFDQSVARDGSYFAVGSWGTVLRRATNISTDVKPPGAASRWPGGYVLGQNYPNPFNPVTTIAYDLPERISVSLIVYDILGREVERLVKDEVQEAGKHKVVLNGERLASGVYFYRLQAGKYVETKKVVLVR